MYSLQNLAGMDEADIIKALLGRPGSEVRLHLQRGNGSDIEVVQLTRRPLCDRSHFPWIAPNSPRPTAMG